MLRERDVLLPLPTLEVPRALLDDFQLLALLLLELLELVLEVVGRRGLGARRAREPGRRGDGVGFLGLPGRGLPRAGGGLAGDGREAERRDGLGVAVGEQGGDGGAGEEARR